MGKKRKFPQQAPRCRPLSEPCTQPICRCGKRLAISGKPVCQPCLDAQHAFELKQFRRLKREADKRKRDVARMARLIEQSPSWRGEPCTH